MADRVVEGCGIRMRFIDKWEIQPDPMPSAYTAVMCSRCCESFSGYGSSLQASTLAAEAKLAMHDCPGFYRMVSK